mmetsp:Transcript_84822/g.252814  ORF Transcript_84822/g.252814 Transcript_84822/m.252814 type:complete len:277 (+) Transcript_84822:204-1034(+)
MAGWSNSKTTSALGVKASKLKAQCTLNSRADDPCRETEGDQPLLGDWRHQETCIARLKMNSTGKLKDEHIIIKLVSMQLPDSFTGFCQTMSILQQNAHSTEQLPTKTWVHCSPRGHPLRRCCRSWVALAMSDANTTSAHAAVRVAVPAHLRGRPAAKASLPPAEDGWEKALVTLLMISSSGCSPSTTSPSVAPLAAVCTLVPRSTSSDQPANSRTWPLGLGTALTTSVKLAVFLNRSTTVRSSELNHKFITLSVGPAPPGGSSAAPELASASPENR